MTTNRPNIPKGMTNAFNRIQMAKLRSCSDHAARQGFRAAPSCDPSIILSIPSKPAEYWRLRDPAESTTFIAETNLCADSTLLALREVRRLLEKLNRVGQTKIDNSV